MLFQLTFPKVYFGGAGYFLQGTVSGKAVSWDISKEDALRLMESIAVSVRRAEVAEQVAA